MVLIGIDGLVCLLISGVTPIGQGWTKRCQGPPGSRGPKPDPIFCIFLYFKC